MNDKQPGHDITIHAAQTAILRELLFTPEASFAQMQKPTGLSSNHFVFHINRLVELGLVRQVASGRYTLTTEGKEYANRLDTDERAVERQGKIAVLVVAVRKREGRTEYMVQKRLKQPYYGFYGFMTGKLRWGETVVAGAKRELLEETGLQGGITIKAMYHKMDYTTDGRLLEDKHFYLVRADNVHGEFTEKFEGGENYWHTMDEILAFDKVFAGMDMAGEMAEADGVQFLEKAFEYTEEDY